jgi:phosphoribosylformylglycinamidine synthase I
VTIAVIVYPGTNCEHDIVHALHLAGADTELVWHSDTDLAGATGVVLPGGFAHGDYLRTGAIARFSPIMEAVIRLVDRGIPTLGICNGFQILTEAGLLPGALIANRDLRFICRPVHLRVESTDSILTRSASIGQVLSVPLNSYEGNYIVDDVDRVEEGHDVILRYCDEHGNVDHDTSPNGSMHSIAGITNSARSVAGLMPHPERASEEILGSADGMILIESFLASTELVTT